MSNNFATLERRHHFPACAYRPVDVYGPEGNLLQTDFGVDRDTGGSSPSYYNTYRFIGRIPTSPADQRSTYEVTAVARAKFGNPRIRVFKTARYWVAYLE